VQKTTELSRKIENIPKEDNTILQKLTNEIKTLEMENQLLRSEMYYYKNLYEKAGQKTKQLESKLSTIAKYFTDYLDDCPIEDPAAKRYQSLLSYLNNNSQNIHHDLATLIGSEVIFTKRNNYGNNSMIDSHSFDIYLTNSSPVPMGQGVSQNESSGGISTQTKSNRKDRIFKTADKIKERCQEFLNKFEEIEEADRLKRLQSIQLVRKQTQAANQGGSEDIPLTSRAKILLESTVLLPIPEIEKEVPKVPKLTLSQAKDLAPKDNMPSKSSTVASSTITNSNPPSATHNLNFKELLEKKSEKLLVNGRASLPPQKPSSEPAKVENITSPNLGAGERKNFSSKLMLTKFSDKVCINLLVLLS